MKYTTQLVAKPIATEGSPVFPHSNGYWAKKIDGKMCYFGQWRKGVTLEEAARKLQARKRQSSPAPVVAAPAKEPHTPRVDADFPLRKRKNGQWGKKVKGTDNVWRWKHFGVLADPEAALARYEAWNASSPASMPSEPVDGPRSVTQNTATVQDMFDHFLDIWEARQQAGQVSAKQIANYRACMQQFASVIPLTKLLKELDDRDFVKVRASWSARYKKVNLKNMMTRLLTIFHRGKRLLPPGFAIEKDYFEKPSLRELRVEKAEGAPRVFAPEVLRRLIDEADAELKAQLLLGINCGFYPIDIKMLPVSALDLGNGWIRYHRNKTGNQRRSPLWPETVAALKAWLELRDPGDEETLKDLVFCVLCAPNEKMSSAPGRAHHHPEGKTAWICGSDRVGRRFATLRDKLEMDAGLNFSMTRHTFATVGDSLGDRAALRTIMGHEGGGGITDYYIHDAANGADMVLQAASSARLKRITDFVRGWLYPPKEKAAKGKKKIS